ncbi:DNA topoisomerase IV subunit B [Rickettsiales bacterium]|nr:DNA topoisomerase IV subunit B [Rickettsiales bacterium]
MSDLFSNTATTQKNIKNIPEKQYTAHDIEVLEGLEPVRHRPGMYIGGTDETALHHLVSEIFDNSMDEAVAGFATYIEIYVQEDGGITISDNGRGIPVDPHPKFPGKSALEVIMTTLHSGGKFDNKVYQTSGGLHGVGISVVNALSEKMTVTVTRNQEVWQQHYSKGHIETPLEKIGTAKKNEHGTKITFYPDHDIFDKEARFRPSVLYKQARSKAYLFKGVEIRWNCAESLINDKNKTPSSDIIHFPNGLVDYLSATIKPENTVTSNPFSGEATFPEGAGRVEWAIHWAYLRDVKTSYYCNTVPTPQGGSHETGLKNALLKAIKEFGELTGNKKTSNIIADDVYSTIHGILSLFIKDPQFQGQTKDKLSNRYVIKLVENAIKDRFDLWLSKNKAEANDLLNFIIERSEERLNRRLSKEITRKAPAQRLRLPGKLTDCTKQTPGGTELFLVEGDSAGGSAKMARNRETQAILPLRGKILNVASASKEKVRANQEINDLNLALGCGTGDQYNESDLRYEKIIIMTDADVDGAHIASLLMTYFYSFMPKLIKNGHLYLAQPPLFRIKQGSKSYYANSDKDKDKIVSQLSKNKGNIEISRFKGLGEMMPSQLKETTMNTKNRTLLRVEISDENQDNAKNRVDELMGKKPELRFKFITEQSQEIKEKISQQLDV